MVALYDYVVPKPKSECNKLEQLEVSFAAGYIAGTTSAVLCSRMHRPPALSQLCQASSCCQHSADSMPRDWLWHKPEHGQLQSSGHGHREQQLRFMSGYAGIVPHISAGGLCTAGSGLAATQQGGTQN